MGFFDRIVGSVLGAAGGGGQVSQLAGTVLGLLNDPKVGGLEGLLKGFKDQGLGKLADSWVSVGKNLPISPEQVQKGLNPQVLQQVASQAGMGVDQVASQLAKVLPGLVDKLTPQGSLPDASGLAQGIEGLKKQFGL